MKTVDKLNAVIIPCSLVVAFGLTYAMRSTGVFFGMVLLVLATQLASGCASALAAVYRKEQPGGPFLGVQIGVVITAALLILLGLTALIERVVWFKGGSIPGVFVTKNYGDRYTPNKHRMLKFACHTRSSAMFVHEGDTHVFARCGEWFPDTYTVAATKKQWERAVDATKGEKSDGAVILEPDDVEYK